MIQTDRRRLAFLELLSEPKRMELQVFIFFIHSIFRKFIIEEFERADTNIQNINMSLETLSQEYTYFVLEPEFCILLLEVTILTVLQCQALLSTRL